jgi:hypothetical protein
VTFVLADNRLYICAYENNFYILKFGNRICMLCAKVVSTELPTLKAHMKKIQIIY